MKRGQDLKILSDVVLFKLYENAQGTGGRITPGQISNLSGFNVSETFVEKALDRLESRGLVHQSLAMGQPPECEIEDAGIGYVQEHLSDPSSNIAQFQRLGGDWLQEDKTPETAPSKVTAASQRSETIPKFRDFRDALLVALARREEADGPDMYDLKETADRAGLAYRKGWVQKAAYYFRDQGLIQGAFTMGDGIDGNLRADLTADGLEFAEELMSAQKNRESITSDEIIEVKTEAKSSFEEEEGPLLDASRNAFVLDSSILAGAPAADRIVSLDHNSKEYRTTVEVLDAVIDEVRKSNEYGDKDPQDRDQRVAELEAGKRLLEAPKVSVNAIQAVIITTLAYLAMKFADAAIGNLASQAIDAVKNLVGL